MKTHLAATIAVLFLLALTVALLSACAPAATTPATVEAPKPPTPSPTAPVLTPAASPIQPGITKPSREPTPPPTIAVTPLSAPLSAGTACRAGTAPTVNLGRLAYVQGGDIWVKSVPDGNPLRLTTDGHNREPRWSPSGQWLAFRTDEREVSVVSADGSQAYALGTGMPIDSFAWSPTADVMAFISEGALLVQGAAGGERRALVKSGDSEPRLGVLSMAWSPDGQSLAFAHEKMLDPSQPPPRDLYASLWHIRADGSGAQELFNAGRPSDYGLIVTGWSSDGQYILFQSDPMFSPSILADGVPLLAIPAQGGTQKELAKTVLAYPDFVVPSPGKTDQLATIVGGYRSIWTNKALHLLSTTGKDVRLTPPEVSASAPDWSPDGQNLAYAAMPDQSDPGPAGVDLPPDKMPYRLFVVNAQGKQPPRQITDDADYRDERPRWSRDGKQLLFVRVDAWKRATVWLIPVTGGTPCWVVDGLSQEPDSSAYYLSPQQVSDLKRTVFPYYGHMKWDALLDWWRGPSAAKP